ncbi:AraC family transcriptional regulator ligand-binding domain-containing protein [Caulobacter sp. KR2-114]|jgi:AraC-like DNA-binding protein|uniref:AraC family transcriptional regulator n=1 Tax=Caulobacter sp. KR2-114 TaxID=3400912 RepID=UPI003C0EC7E8
MAEFLEQLPMPLAYFRLILRGFGDTPARREAILAGTGVSEEMLLDPSAEISLRHQIVQIENLIGLFGEGWALRAPALWNSTTSHGPLGVAGLAAPDLATMMDLIARFGFVRAPFHRTSLRRGANWCQLDFDLTVDIEERLWRSMMEIAFIGIRAGIGAVLAAPPTQARFFFACAEPDHAREVRAVLGDGVVYRARGNAIRFPAAWLKLPSPFADAALYAVAVRELQEAKARIAVPVDLLGRVERILKSQPAGRLAADEVARLTGVSRRTLVRRLSEAGTGYRELLDRELRGRAERLLQEDSLSHARIAEELGYTDPSSFSRACRRWFGRASQVSR